MNGVVVVNMLAAWPVRLEYFSGWAALGLFALLALPIVLLGIRSLNGLGPVRKWVAIAVRLAVILLVVLILGGVRWQRQNKDLEVMVVRDVSQSTSLVQSYPDQTLKQSLDDFLLKASDAKHKPPNDRIGQLSFARDSLVDSMPSTRLDLGSSAIRDDQSGTDIGSAIQLALAAMGKDAMHRLVLITDGNATMGDLDAAINAAAAQHVPIDVVPLHYNVQNEVLVDRLVAPTIRREDEDFSIDVVIKSTNATPVPARLSVYHQNQPMDLDPYTPGVQSTKVVTLRPGTNVERIRVPGQSSAGVHQFRAVVEAENVSASVQQSGGGATSLMGQGDTLASNNQGTAFTFVRGQGKVLYINNVNDPDDQPGKLLTEALEKEGIGLVEASVDRFPTDLVTLQNYDAVILANVPRGHDGLTEEQQALLASYVHDTGGGLIMIGGPDTFGAGGWQGSKLEEVLPVNMDIPAERQIPKGALVMIMHACEFADGNYWGAQCAIKAAEALSESDEVGVISYNWHGLGGGAGGSQWDYPLQPRGNGNAVTAAIKRMQMGDMPSFDDSLSAALNGTPGNPGLLASDAKQKHIIIISDGDPSAANQALLQKCVDNKITISTVQVYPHASMDNLKPMADFTHGKAYGPINNNPSQLPQIFIKEATVVRRSLIYEDLRNGIPLKLPPTISDVLKGVQVPPAVAGLVLTSRKNSPTVEMPIVAGPNNDPLLAIWQAGLGKAAAFTSDAHNRWDARWVGMNSYATFWAQLVRAVSRPAQSSDFDVQTTITGQTGKIVVEALNKDSSYANFVSIAGKVMGPDLAPHDVRLVQTGPGTYEATFVATEAGNYVLVLNHRSPDGKNGVIVSGAAMNNAPELRQLQSNDALLADIARRTGGRELSDPFDADHAGFFRREGLKQSASPLPVWDLLVPWLLGLILVDVATRRIAWDWQAVKRWSAAAADMVRSYTLSRSKVETRQSVDALKRVRSEVAERARADEPQPVGSAPTGTAPAPDPRAKFQAQGVEGDITKVVGGATDKPIPSAPKKVEPKGAAGLGGHTGSLLEAKRRAQQKIRDKEKD